MLCCVHDGRTIGPTGAAPGQHRSACSSQVDQRAVSPRHGCVESIAGTPGCKVARGGRDQASLATDPRTCTRDRLRILAVSAEEIDDYLRGVEEPKRSTLEALRVAILELIPEAEQGISYGMPAFRLRGKTIAGFAAFKNHLSYLPHSGRVLGELAGDLSGYTMTKGSLHFPVDRPLPKAVVKKLLAARVREADQRLR